MATTEEAASSKRRHNGRKPRLNLSAEQEREIIDTYANTDVSMHTFARERGYNPTYPYRTLERYHIGWRRGHTESFAEWLRDHPEVHLPGEPSVKDEADFTSESPGHDMIPTIQYIGGHPKATWAIEITEQFAIAADDIEAALSYAKQVRPGARITSIRLQA